MAQNLYYTYKDPYPATLNHPHAVSKPELVQDWPRSYRTKSNQLQNQGIHASAGAFDFNPAAHPHYAGHQQMWPQYYGAQQAPQAAGYGYWPPINHYSPYQFAGTSYSSPCYFQKHPHPVYPPSHQQWLSPWAAQPNATFPPYNPNLDYYRKLITYMTAAKQYSSNPPIGPGAAAGWQWPPPVDPASMNAQAAQAAAANAALAAMPQAPNYYVGAGPTDYYAQQAYLVAQMGMAQPAAANQLAPFKPIDGTAFWCRELDSTYTMRSHADILAGECSPGHWERSPTSGYYWWHRDG